jgi:hypothetical protein
LLDDYEVETAIAYRERYVDGHEEQRTSIYLQLALLFGSLVAVGGMCIQNIEISDVVVGGRRPSALRIFLFIDF